MKKLLLTLAMSAMMISGYSADNQHTPQTEIDRYMSSVISRANQTDRHWRKSDAAALISPQKRVVSKIEDYIGPSSSWGSVYTPDGVEWMYTADYKISEVNEYTTTIESADITLYNENFEVYKTFTATFELQPGEVAINFVQVSPLLTRKFFDINDSYEVMVYVHAVTEDYNGSYYTQVYSLANGKCLTTIPGNEVGAVNTATDSWSEKYTMVFMREEVVESESSFGYYLYFDVYSRAGWGGGCNLEHTFKIDYSLISGAGTNALPLLINKKNNDIYYALPRYEKPYFVSDWSEEVTPDNHFIIDLYDSSFNLVRTTSIPMETAEGAIFTFPGLGGLNGNGDMTFGVYGDTDDPVYIIGQEDYITSMDDYVTSFYIYDADGNKVNTIVEGAQDYLYMSDVAGFEDQYCFYYPNDDMGYFKFVNLPSCTEGAYLDIKMDESNITTTIDRVPVGSTYKYVSSMAQAEVDADDNVIHRIVWFDEDGGVNRIDGINLGKNVAMAQPYIAAEALSPYLYNTTSNYEYMFLVKEYVDITTTTRTQESFRVYDDQSNMLLDLGPDTENDEYLSSIFLLNTTTNRPTLVVAYYGDNDYTIRHMKLPLEKFNGGSGTSKDPYMIASAGDLQAIYTAPNAYYALACDIDMNNEVFSCNKCTFSGQLDGRGYTISNLNLKGGAIFSNLDSKAVIKDLNFDGVTCSPSGISGILVSYIDGGESASNAPSIKNVHFTNVDVFSGDRDLIFGCIAGATSLYTSISDCSATDISISAHNGIVGGLVGRLNTSSSVTRCWVDGKISGNVAGGIAGESQRGDETVNDCHVHADIEAISEAGGIIGHSARSIIYNCYVDGSVAAYGSERAYVGGIVGYMSSTFDTISQMVIANCIVNAEISVNAEAGEAIAHRIAGFTSIDEMLVDWDSKDPNVDWTDPTTYPYIHGSIEGAINNNYAIDTPIIDQAIGNDSGSTEGQTLTREELTNDFLRNHGWLLGDTAMSPWKLAGKALALYTEDFTLTADAEEIHTSAAASSWTVTCASRYAADIKFEMSAPEAGTITGIEVSADGKSATVNFSGCTQSGTLTAVLGNDSVVCQLINQTSGIDVVEASCAITYDGSNVVCHGADIAVYNIAGVLIAEGHDTVSVSSLPTGAYVAVSGNYVYKFSK